MAEVLALQEHPAAAHVGAQPARLGDGRLAPGVAARAARRARPGRPGPRAPRARPPRARRGPGPASRARTARRSLRSAPGRRGGPPRLTSPPSAASMKRRMSLASFTPGRRLDAARHVHRERPDRPHRLRHVGRAEAAGEDHRQRRRGGGRERPVEGRRRCRRSRGSARRGGTRPPRRPRAPRARRRPHADRLHHRERERRAERRRLVAVELARRRRTRRSPRAASSRVGSTKTPNVVTSGGSRSTIARAAAGGDVPLRPRPEVEAERVGAEPRRGERVLEAGDAADFHQCGGCAPALLSRARRRRESAASSDHGPTPRRGP